MLKQAEDVIPETLGIANEKLDGMLKAAGLPKRPSYNRSEVCKILHISERTFWRYVTNHDLDPVTSQAISPWTLDSYMTRGHYRVRYDELASWLARNRTYERINAEDPNQLTLPGFD